jgi:hypothetical protein
LNAVSASPVEHAARRTKLDAGLALATQESLEEQTGRFLAFRGTAPGELIELQALPGSRPKYPRPESFRSHSIDAIVDGLRQMDSRPIGDVLGVFMIANHVDPAIAARGLVDGWQPIRKGGGTKDSDMSSRAVMYFDFDADRPSGISSTEEQHAVAHACASVCYLEIATHLGDDNGSAVGFGDSGNGAHVYLALADLPCTPEVEGVIKALLLAGHALFGTPNVKVDQTVSDAKRLCPAFGTTKRKGEHMPDRPHRRTLFWAEAGALPTSSPTSSRSVLCPRPTPRRLATTEYGFRLAASVRRSTAPTPFLRGLPVSVHEACVRVLNSATPERTDGPGPRSLDRRRGLPHAANASALSKKFVSRLCRPARARAPLRFAAWISPHCARVGFPGGGLLPRQDLLDLSLSSHLAHLLPHAGFQRRTAA